MLLARSLYKSYGSLKAVDGISIEAHSGQVLGLLGPNGAGKTTTISMIAGLLRPDSGELRIGGQTIDSDTSPVKRQLGLVPQELALFEELSAARNLSLFAALYGLSGRAATGAIDRVLELTGLRDRAKDRTATFSGGMKRRLNLAAALLHDPQVLLLDEPTVGVDPQSRNAIFDNLETLKAQGKTLIYTTHYMEEAERLCDRIVIVDHGREIANDTVPGLLKRLPAANVLEVGLARNRAPDLERLRAQPGVLSAEFAGHQLTMGIDDTGAIPRILEWLGAQDARFDHVNTRRPTLEAVFLHLTGRSLRDA